MHSGSNNSYDFHCGNDSRFVRIAVKSNIFHTLRIQAEAARSINLMGGTRNVEEILITKCFKLTRIHWPKHAGSITRLRIYLAESMTRLDLSGLALQGLLELSILDCAKLTSITGLPDSLKWLNIDGANINNLDVSHCQQLEVFNISTLSPTFTADLAHLPSLQSVSVSTTADKTDESKITCRIEDCEALQLLNISTGDIPAYISLKTCPNLTKAAISCGHRSELSGLSTCTKLAFFHSNRPDIIKMDSVHSDSLAVKDEMADIKDTLTKFSKPILYPEPGPDDDETIIQLHGSPRERNHACMMRINLLSRPSEPPDERFSKAFNKRTKRSIESLPNYLGGAAAYIYYLDKTVKKKELEGLRKSAVIPSQAADTFGEWLKNPKTHHPNTLMITSENISMPSMIEFIKSYRPNKRLVIHQGKYYRLTPTHKVVAEESVKNIIDNVLALQPAPAAAITKTATAVQQHIAAALGAPSPALSPSQLQAQIGGFTNQLTQAYNHYVNQLVSSTTNRPPAIESNEPIPPHARLSSGAKSQPVDKSTSRPSAQGIISSENDNDIINAVKAKAAGTKGVALSTAQPFNTDNLPDSTHGSLDANDDDDIIHAAKAKAAGTSEATLPTPMSFDIDNLPEDKHGSLEPNDDKDDILHPARVKTTAAEKAAIPVPQHFSPEESPKPGHGILEPSKDQLDELLKSAQANAEANQHKIVFETLPAGQHGTLDTNQMQSEDPLDSANVNVEATGKTTSAAKLLDASKQLAEAMQQMANTAKESVPVDDESHDHLDDAAELIDDSIKTLMTTAAATADLSDEAALRESLGAANQLANAIKRLNAACGQLHAAVKNISQPASTKSDKRTDTTHNQLIQALTDIKEEFIQLHRAKKLNEGLFGTGFQAGMNNMRLEFLNTLLDALKNNQPLPEKDVDQYLKDIMGSPQLKKVLTPHEADLRKCLTGSGHTLTSKRPPKLNE